jgi:hypothetical protein
MLDAALHVLQRAQQPLLPLLETRLKQHAQAAAAAVAGPTTGELHLQSVASCVTWWHNTCTVGYSPAALAQLPY